MAISPSRFGAGVKLKTVEAVQHGVPVVSTVEAAAGLSPGLRSVLAVTDDPRVFADTVVALLTDRGAWQRSRTRQLAQIDADAVQRAGVGRWPTIVRTVAETASREVSR